MACAPGRRALARPPAPAAPSWPRKIESRLAFDLSEPTILVAFHPVTIAPDTIRKRTHCLPRSRSSRSKFCSAIRTPTREAET